MTAAGDRFRRTDEVFRAACRLAAAERERFIEEACAGDDVLRDEVLGLLRADRHADGFLEAPAFRAAVDAAPLSLQDADPGADQPPLPERIQRYRILRQIGAGGMGVVYEAEQDSPRRTVALKVIRSANASPELRRRFELEGQVLARLRHPGIAQIFEAGHTQPGDDGTGDRLFFAMELARGLPLTDYADANALDVSARLELFALVCDAVHHAHQNGIIHRDLKPGNIIVDRREGTDGASGAAVVGGQPKILDFGVARALDSDMAATQHTGVGQVIGTVPYMSPEQAAGDVHAIDIRSDVYALGVNLFELLTGRLPYDVRDKSFLHAAQTIRQQEAATLSSIDRRLRGDLQTIVAKALEKDRDRRYQSAAELAADLRRFLRYEPIIARPATTMYQLRKLAQRNKPLVGALALAVLCMIGGTTASIILAVRAAGSEAAALVERNAAIKAREAEAAQRRTAERRFAEVRAMANTLLFRIADLIREIPGSTEASAVVVATAQRYLDGLAAEAGDDPAILDELADAYLRLGDIQGNANVANLGRSQDAIRSYQAALDIRDRLAAASPGAIANRLKQATVLSRIGGHLATVGCSTDALACYDRSLAIESALTGEHPELIGVRRQLAETYSRIGDIQRRRAGHGDALDSYRFALAITESCLADDPHPASVIRALAIAMTDVGNALHSLGRLEGALAHLEPALRLREDLAAAAPDARRARRDVAVGLQRLGSLRSNLGQGDRALAAFRRAAAIFEELVEADAADTRARGDLAVILEKVGDALRDCGRSAEALAEYERCLRIRSELVLADPTSAVYRVGLAIAHERAGDMLRDAGRPEAAFPRYLDAIAIAEDLVRSDPRDALANAIVVISSGKLGDHHAAAAAGSPSADAGRAHWEQSLRWRTRCLEGLAQAAQRRVRLPEIAPGREEVLAAIADSTAALAAGRDEGAGR